MSDGLARRRNLDALEAPLCERCGTVIDEPDRPCPALGAGEGVCAP